jgi:hypothetical protein
MKAYIGLILVSLLFIFTSEASGLSVSVSTGNSVISSSMSTGYGATEIDRVDQNIKINPSEGTLSNAFSGTGSLKDQTMTITNSKAGTKASVNRGIEGKPGVTTWSYEWDTTPLTSNGVKAWVKMDVKNAYQIFAGSSSSNREGDAAYVEAWVGSPATREITSSTQPSASISNYYAEAFAYPSRAEAYEKATSATSDYTITFSGRTENREGDYADASEIVQSTPTPSAEAREPSIMNNPTVHSYASSTKSYVYPTASSIATTEEAVLWSFATNKEKDRSEFRLDLVGTNPYESLNKINYGILVGPNFYGSSQKKSADTYATIANANGKSVTMTSEVSDTAKGYEYNLETNPRTMIPVNLGSGAFEALRTDYNPFVNVELKSHAEKNDVVITAKGFGSKTALILDPRSYEFSTFLNQRSFPGTVKNALTRSGYAVTYYGDAAVSKDKVKQMDDYWVSVLLSHAGPLGLQLSKSSNGKTFDIIGASELKRGYTKSNGMALLVGCNTFTDVSPVLTLNDAVKNAIVRGGIKGTWNVGSPELFLTYFFINMANGKTASQANNAASFADSATGKVNKLSLEGNGNFKL